MRRRDTRRPATIRAITGVLTAAALAWAVGGSGLPGPFGGPASDSRPRAASAPAQGPCGADQLLAPAAGGRPAACAHSDAPPRGVDVTRKVSTSELRARRGVAASLVR